MAKRSHWNTFPEMAADVSRILYKLGVNDNFAAAEFSFKAYTPDITAAPAMPLGVRINIVGRYFDLGSLVYATASGLLGVTAGGAAQTAIWISLPFPYQPVFTPDPTNFPVLPVLPDEVSIHRFNTHCAYSGGLVSVGPHGILSNMQWVKIPLLDASTGIAASHVPGETLQFSISGIYEKDPKYHYSSTVVGPLPPVSF